MCEVAQERVAFKGDNRVWMFDYILVPIQIKCDPKETEDQLIYGLLFYDTYVL